MGVRTPVSRNPAMVLGGLKQGVTPLEMAKAYETLAAGGEAVSGTLAPREGAPVTYTRVEGGGIDDKNKTRRKRVIPEGVAKQATQILSTVVTAGTGRAANIGEFAAGKTGTTENYQDAWFVGFTDNMTVAVWVGYPEGGKPMETEYRGEPVAGGTFPAEIWRDFMLSVKKIRRDALAGQGQAGRDPGTDRSQRSGAGPGRATATRSRSARRTGKPKRTPERTPEGGAPAPPQPAPEPTPEPQPAPAPTPGGRPRRRRHRAEGAAPAGPRAAPAPASLSLLVRRRRKLTAPGQAPRRRLPRASASSTRSSCFLGDTFGNAFTIFPFGPMMNVARCTPQYRRPYMDFSTQTPYFSATLWSGSERRMCGRSCFVAEAVQLLRASREMPITTAPAASYRPSAL